MFRRARLQLAGSFALALAVLLLAVGGAAYVAIRHELDTEINDSLRHAADDLQRLGVAAAPPTATPSRTSAGRDGRRADNDDDDHEEDRGRIVASEVYFVTTDAAGTVLSNPRMVNVEDVPFADLAADATEDGHFHDLGTGSRHARFLTLPANSAGQYLHVGRSLSPRDTQLRSLAVVFAVGGAAGLALAAGGGLWLAGRALRPIRESMELQRQFLSDASHELRTPIAVVRANNELLMRHVDRPLEESLDQVEAIAAETEHMTRLVGDLLTLARADEGRLELPMERLDLGALVQEVVRDMAAVAELHGVRLESEVTPVEVDGSAHHLRQLAVILVDNALKFTPAGGTVAVRVRRSGRRAELSVTDAGPGIPAAHQRRIFDRFYRVDAARTRGDGGSGLGLAIASRLAAAHHGSIAVESPEGAGATFTVRLPLAG